VPEGDRLRVCLSQRPEVERCLCLFARSPGVATLTGSSHGSPAGRRRYVRSLASSCPSVIPTRSRKRATFSACEPKKSLPCQQQ
jgi:hypothetical protein